MNSSNYQLISVNRIELFLDVLSTQNYTHTYEHHRIPLKGFVLIKNSKWKHWNVWVEYVNNFFFNWNKICLL